MLNSTFQIVADHPATILPLLFTVWFVYRLVKRNRTKVFHTAARVAVIMVVPVFALSFLAEFTANPFFDELSELLIQLEMSLIDLLFQFIDAVFAAELRVVLLILGGLWDSIQELLSSVVPVMEASEILLTLFGFEFFAGAILIYSLYISSRGSNLDFSLKGIGIVLLVSGLFATLIQLDTWQVSRSLLVLAFIAAILGFTLGVATVILLVRPNFGGESVVSELQETTEWSGEGDEVHRGSQVMKTMSRLSQIVSRRRE
ncbi:hypothetical protein [Haladaptatus sp. DFWS20]|uniref:hypothetical protein n=1 Tax=Haladaptatus sp. DFWS20 TaxID=3403467 RepID=UPI003EBF8774